MYLEPPQLPDARFAYQLQRAHMNKGAWGDLVAFDNQQPYIDVTTSRLVWIVASAKYTAPDGWQETYLYTIGGKVYPSYCLDPFDETDKIHRLIFTRRIGA